LCVNLGVCIIFSVFICTQGENNVTGKIDPGLFRVYRYAVRSTLHFKIDPLDENVRIKEGYVSFTDTDRGLDVKNVTEILLCNGEFLYVGIEGRNTSYDFEIWITKISSESKQCGFFIPPSMILSLGVGGIFLFVGIVFFVFACFYKRKYRTARGYLHMSDNQMEETPPDDDQTNTSVYNL